LPAVSKARNLFAAMLGAVLRITKEWVTGLCGAQRRALAPARMIETKEE